jgi:HK97 gp10 family phage protein
MINSEVKWYGKQFESIFNVDSGIIFKEEAENAIKMMKEEIEKNQSKGNTYYRTKNGSSKKVVASIAGATPNNNFNDLSNSFSVSQINEQKYLVSSDSPYVVFLEFGTSKMAARPFFRRNVRKAIERVQERIKLKFPNVERFK